LEGSNIIAMSEDIKMSKIGTISKFFVKKLVSEAVLPAKATPGSAGYDLCSIEDVIIPPNSKGKVKTGLSFMIPTNTYARIAPRSGLAWKNSINVGAGVVDEDYRG
jgi:dUTP pyrophosphatase